MKQPDKQPKRRKKHAKYDTELNRMDYEGGNSGDPEQISEPEEKKEPVKAKARETNNAPSKRRADNANRRGEEEVR